MVILDIWPGEAARGFEPIKRPVPPWQAPIPCQVSVYRVQGDAEVQGLMLVSVRNAGCPAKTGLGWRLLAGISDARLLR